MFLVDPGRAIGRSKHNDSRQEKEKEGDWQASRQESLDQLSFCLRHTFLPFRSPLSPFDSQKSSNSSSAADFTFFGMALAHGTVYSKQKKTAFLSSSLVLMNQTTSYSYTFGKDGKVEQPSSDGKGQNDSGGGRETGEPSKGAEEPQFNCAICLDQPADPIVTMCGHMFCWECIREVWGLPSLFLPVSPLPSG